MSIQKAVQQDLDIIFELYEDATRYQHEKGVSLPWAGFQPSLIETEIEAGRLFKIMEGEWVACVFSVAFTDPLIWGEKNADPALYLHRIAVSRHFRGRGYLKSILEWCHSLGQQHQKKWLRLDTNFDNTPLLNYYKKCGFQFMGNVKPAHTDGLPKHYENITLATFEMAIIPPHQP